jgi:hypothetical protein
LPHETERGVGALGRLPEDGDQCGFGQVAVDILRGFFGPKAA